MRKAALFFIVLTLAAAPTTARSEKRERERVIDWQSEVVVDAPINRTLANRIFARLTLDPSRDGWSLGGRYGLRWRPTEALTLAPLAGFSARTTKDDTESSFTLSLWSELALPVGFSLRAESDHLIGRRYHYQGFYSLDWWCLGVHVDQWDSNAAAGPHLSSGRGLRPFRIEIRHSLGVTDGSPDQAVRIVLSIDTR